LVPASCGGASDAPQLAARVRRRRFTGNYIMETYKRRYELKKQIYFEVLNHIVKARKINEDLLKDGMEVWKWGNKLDIEPYKSWFMTYELLSLKLDICGEEKIKQIMQSICDRPFLKDVDSLHKTYDDLIGIMKQELNKPWWQLWK